MQLERYILKLEREILSLKRNNAPALQRMREEMRNLLIRRQNLIFGEYEKSSSFEGP